MRTEFIKNLIAHAKNKKNIFLLVADIGYGVVEEFQKEFPDRFMNVGVAEQNMTGIAAGLASEGYHVFTYSIANFPTFRCAEQIRNDIDYHNLPVTIVSVGGGLAYGNLGYSHHAIQDYGLLRMMPNFSIASPGDPIEVNGLLLVAPASDYQYLVFHPGNNSPHYGFLPSYAATAYYHGKIETNKTLQEFYEDSKKFSLEVYGPALLKGTRISEDEKNSVMKQYSEFTGLSLRFVEDFDMRVDPSSFRKELLRDEGYSVGRLDSRYKNSDYMAGGQYPDTDVSSEGFMSAYVSAIHTWFSEIGVEMKMLYQSGDYDVYSSWKHPQEWKGNDFGYVNTVPDIARAQRYNKDFKVYVSCGLYDLATPCFTAENFMYDNSVDMSRVVFSEFEAGHMMYNHQPSFDRFLKEVRSFIISEIGRAHV